MAGRILPIALATVAGVAIGVSTFDPELKERQRKRLEEEFKRDVATAGLKRENESPTQNKPATPQETKPFPDSKETKSSGISSIFGLWAWKKGWGSNTTAPTTNEPQQSTKASDGQNRQP